MGLVARLRVVQRVLKVEHERLSRMEEREVENVLDPLTADGKCRDCKSDDAVEVVAPEGPLQSALVVFDPEWAEYIVARKQRKGKYIFEVAARVHLQMGGRPTTVAQRRSSRILAARLMIEDGHRPTHVERDLPCVIMSLVTPTVAEEDLDEWFATALSDTPSRHRHWTASLMTIMRA